MGGAQRITMDESYMKEAVGLARKGLGNTSPNPMVGAVIVRDNRVIGRGFHKEYGGKHAEINAIEDAGGNVKEAMLYVTLEPCCHYEKINPPCVGALVESGIGQVVIGTLDPNPLVNGKGVEGLLSNGIEVTTGVWGEECSRLNEAYFKHVRTGLPFVTGKYAQTLDGRIATKTGSSQWISSSDARKYAHRLRSISDCVVVGIGTVVSDNPRLNVRLVKGKEPIPVVVDSTLRVSPDAQVLNSRRQSKPIIVTTSKADGTRISSLEQAGAQILVVGQDADGRVDVTEMMERLGAMGMTSALVEGGSALITSLLRKKLVDKLVVFIAPKLLGEGLEAIGDLGILRVDDAIRLSYRKVRRLGDDLIFEAMIGAS